MFCPRQDAGKKKQIKLTLRGPSAVQTSQRVVDRLGLHDTDESDSEAGPPPAAGRKRPAEEPAAAARPAKVRAVGGRRGCRG